MVWNGMEWCGMVNHGEAWLGLGETSLYFGKSLPKSRSVLKFIFFYNV
jgi:hypothetical protein